MTRFSVRRVTPTSVLPLDKVIKGDALNVIAPARALVGEIEKHAETVYSEAFARGRAAGEAKGEKAGATLLAETVFAVRSHLSESEGRLAEIVVQAIRRVVGALDIDDLVVGMVRQLVAEARDAARIRLSVPPAHHGRVRNLVDSLAKEQINLEAIEVTVDGALGEGNCRMETEAGSLETSIENQVEALRAAIDKHLSD